jgi:hypothetical protein
VKTLQTELTNQSIPARVNNNNNNKFLKNRFLSFKHHNHNLFNKIHMMHLHNLSTPMKTTLQNLQTSANNVRWMQRMVLPYKIVSKKNKANNVLMIDFNMYKTFYLLFFFK